jgi:hypothetical protein
MSSVFFGGAVILDFAFLAFLIYQVVLAFQVMIFAHNNENLAMIYPHTLDRLNGQFEWAPLSYVKESKSDFCSSGEAEVFYYTRGKVKCGDKTRKDRRMLQHGGGSSDDGC